MKIRKPAKTPTRRLFLESLEGRELMAGNVTATYSAGTLTVTGNDAANNVVIWQNPNTGVFRVTGNATNVNNVAAAFVAPGPVNNITVNGNGGNDTITIGAGTTAAIAGGANATAAEVSGFVNVNGGNGSDTITVRVTGGNLPVVGIPQPTLSVSIDGGAEATTVTAQNDTINVFDSFINLLTIEGRDGNDTISVGGVGNPTVVVNATINSGVGTASTRDNDTVNLNFMAALVANVNLGTSNTTAASPNVAQSNNLNLGTAGPALIGTLTVTGGAGRDRITAGPLGGLLTLNTTINTGAGSDVVLLSNTQAGLTAADLQGLAAILPLGLNAVVGSLPSIPGNLTINTGDGNDQVGLTNVTVTNLLLVNLGSGNDLFRPATSVAGLAIIDGGTNTGTAVNGDRRRANGLTTTIIAAPTYLNFENTTLTTLPVV